MNANKAVKHNKDELLKAAAKAAMGAYTLSGFRVGASVRANGRMFVGANVENSSLGLSICAERIALANAVIAGCRDIEAIAIACIDARKVGGLAEKMPCGACRQWFAELAPHAKIFVMGSDAEFDVECLLPHAFRYGKSKQRIRGKEKGMLGSKNRGSSARILID